MSKSPGHGKAPDGCRACRGTGYVPRESHQIDPATGLEVTIYAQACCSCPKGVWREQNARRRRFLAEVR